MMKADLKNVNYFKVHTGIQLLIETAILKCCMSGLAQGLPSTTKVQQYSEQTIAVNTGFAMYATIMWHGCCNVIGKEKLMINDEWFGKIQTSEAHWKMLPQDCGGRQLNPWRFNSGSPTSFCKMSQSPKRLGLLRYVSKSSSWVVGEPDSMGSGWYISRGEFRGWGVSFCSESRERDKRTMVFLYSWLLLFLVLLSLRKWEWQKCDVLHIPKKTGRTIRTKRIRFSAFFCMQSLIATATQDTHF